MKRRDFVKQAAVAAAGLSASPLHAFASGKPPPQNRGPRKKVIIVGAGLAGLSAAYELAAAGHDVIVLEAQGRPGGRVLTLRDGFADGLHAEAGATRIPNHHDFTLGYAARFGLALDPFRPGGASTVYHVRGERITSAPGAPVAWPHRLSPQERGLGPGGLRDRYIGPVLAELGDVTDPAWPPAALAPYDQMNRSDFLRSRGASDEAIALMTLGGIDDRAETVSALFTLRNSALNQALTGYQKIRGGTDLLPRAFAGQLQDRVRYGTPVVRIEQDAQGVRAVFRSAGSFHTLAGDYLVCAVPFSVQKNIEVSPPFSVQKQRAIEQLPYHSASKVFLQSRTRFWTDEGLDGFGSTDLAIGQVWDVTHGQPGTRGILQAFPISLHSRRVTAMPEADRVGFALEQVDRLYPGMRGNFEGGVSKCWDEDEWARGATSFYKPGQMTSLLPHVARPEGRVHFAGEHTSVWIDGWMQGALESGSRVAREVNAASP